MQALNKSDHSYQGYRPSLGGNKTILRMKLYYHTSNCIQAQSLTWIERDISNDEIKEAISSLSKDRAPCPWFSYCFLPTVLGSN